VTLSLQKTKKVEEGKDVQMKCIVSKPNLKAKWTFNSKVIKNMGTRILVESSEMVHQLTIRNVTMDDAGEYCLEIEDLQEKTILEVCGRFIMILALFSLFKSRSDTVRTVRHSKNWNHLKTA
jgi:hypothetical protein